MNLFKRIINFGIDESWDLDKKRSFRQVNEFNFFVSLVALSAFPIALYYKVYFGFFIQLAGFITYLSGFWLISKQRLKFARLLSIYTFETHMFLISFFALYPTSIRIMPWYSPIFISYTAYPLLAALFDKPVFKHMGMAVLQIILLQFVGFFLIRIGFKKFPVVNLDALNLIICIYTIGITSLIVFLVVTENRTVKNLEIKRSNQLEKALSDVELSRAQVTLQAKELRKINDAKSKFFSIIAHDLRSPYNAVLGLSELLQRKSINDPVYYKYAKTLHDAALNTYSLLENLLEWSRAQLDRIEFNPDSVKLDEVLSKDVDFVTITAQKKNITLEKEIDDALLVWADKNLLSIINRNLLTNAIKFTNPGGVIEVTAKPKIKYVEIAVKDNGIGMPEDMTRRLFRIDEKQSRYGTAEEKGTGLGLFLCKEFVDMHGGKIRVESEENRGTTFYFTLPLAKE